MTTFLTIIIILLLGVIAWYGLKYWRLILLTKHHLERLGVLSKEFAEAQRRHIEEYSRLQAEKESGIAGAQLLADQHFQKMKAESERIRQYFEAEARKAQEEADAKVSVLTEELEPLRKYKDVKDAEAESRRVLADAIADANALRNEAQNLLEQSRTVASQERIRARERATELRTQAESRLNQAIRDSAKMLADATKRAEQIAGDAYVALRDKQTLEQAVVSLWNITEGYGDRFIVPTRSLLDDLAQDFSHTKAGIELEAARDLTRRLVEQRQAATCNYEEADRRDRANRFVVDAFNGRVDAILSRVKHNNYGTLEQEVRDAFNLVNLNGLAFRDAHILPAYLDARLAELKWAVVTQELRLREREEQRRIQEQMREEEKVRRERERAIKEAQDKEDAIKTALTQARLEAQRSSVQERARFDTQIEDLTKRLAEAVSSKEREISMAQLTRAGNVYIISNIGSFGDDVYKIGMTRRLDPMERIWELGSASVPFEFDVHAMLYSQDAPSLEKMLHNAFDDLRINKVNSRKEFFKMPLERIKTLVAEKGLQATFTMAAEAREFRETQAVQRMTLEKQEKFKLGIAESQHD